MTPGCREARGGTLVLGALAPSRAVARPMPLPAPVMTAVVPSSFVRVTVASSKNSGKCTS